MTEWLFKFGRKNQFFEIFQSATPDQRLDLDIEYFDEFSQGEFTKGDLIYLWNTENDEGFVGWVYVLTSGYSHLIRGDNMHAMLVSVALGDSWAPGVSLEQIRQYSAAHGLKEVSLPKGPLDKLSLGESDILVLHVPDQKRAPKFVASNKAIEREAFNDQRKPDEQNDALEPDTSQQETMESLRQVDRLAAMEKAGRVNLHRDKPANEQEDPPEEDTAESELEANAALIRTSIASAQREPKEHQVGLNVVDYALSLATLLRSSGGEVCMALFGHWGLGKTFLASKVGKMMAEPDHYAETLAKHYKTDEGAKNIDHDQHDVVWYSAWQYRRIPEQWIYLYETLAEHSKKAPWYTRLGRLVRFGVEKNGLRELFMGLLSLWIVLLPFAALLEAIYLLASAVGVVGLVYVISAFRKGRGSADQLLAKYAKLPKHSDGLGLQALIGEDVKALVMAWFPGDSHTLRRYAGAAIFLVLLAGVALYLLYQAGRSGIDVPVWARDMAVLMMGAEAAPQSADLNWVPVAAYGLWLALVLAIFAAAILATGKSKKLLLIIDDLDRCDPGEVVDLIEGIKVLLEHEEIQKRVQVMMLIDERVLHHAIFKKFEDLFEKPQADSPGIHYRPFDIYSEHLEKLFLCWFRLPTLTAAEAAGILAKYTDKEGFDNDRRRAQIEKQMEQMRKHGVPTNDINDGEILPLGSSQLGVARAQWQQEIGQLQADLKALDEVEPEPGLAAADVVYSEDEGVALEAALEIRLRNLDDDSRVVTPRMLRTVLLKYQLARLVFMLLNRRPLEGEERDQMTRELVDTLFDVTLKQKMSLRDPAGDRKSVSCIASQVA